MIHHAPRHAHQDCERSAACRHRRKTGFTIIELLVIVAIISVLIGLLMPAMRSVRVNMHQTNEMNTARQLMGAYHAYANANRDRLLTGVAPDNFNVFDEHGRLLSKNAPGLQVRTYPWRIAPYLSFDMRGLFVNQHRELLEELRYEESDADYIYKVGLAPSLGMNTQWIGGDSMDDIQPPAFLEPGSQADEMWSKLLDLRRYYVTRSSHVIHPNRLIVFASARSRDTVGIIGNNVIIEGNFRIRSPYITALDPEPQWSESFNPNEEPHEYGHVSPRYFRRAVAAFMDGSVNMLDTQQLRDMRHWANWADSEDWVLPMKE